MSRSCPKCNAKNPDSAKFCRSCGTEISADSDIKGCLYVLGGIFVYGIGIVLLGLALGGLGMLIFG